MWPTSTIRVVPCSRSRTSSPGETEVAGFAGLSFTRTWPPRHACAASARVLTRRTAHSHLSTRVLGGPCGSGGCGAGPASSRRSSVTVGPSLRRTVPVGPGPGAPRTLLLCTLRPRTRDAPRPDALTTPDSAPISGPASTSPDSRPRICLPATPSPAPTSTSSCRGSARHRPLPRPRARRAFPPPPAPRPPLILEVSTGPGPLTGTGQRSSTRRYLAELRPLGGGPSLSRRRWARGGAAPRVGEGAEREPFLPRAGGGRLRNPSVGGEAAAVPGPTMGP